ncbi:cytochrome b5 domain-containing protein [Paenibacillus chungangensis]|uniref:Cytochrome b5 domain-containing protein n=1 Tax=Paenibacillus chungangensis TaxID=696535 RepID=A0ABW3HNI3_9BACL
MSNPALVRQQKNILFSEIQYLIRLLYVTQDPDMKNLTLNQLWNKVDQLQFLTHLEGSSCPYTSASSPGEMTMPTALPMSAMPAQPQLPAASLPSQGMPQSQTMPSSPNPQQSFTREQLAQFDGRNGRPAYVAVKGIVYDVTNNAAWSAASHFGLSAGKDLTQEFASCHAGEQWILNTLTPVGRLVD